MNNSNREIQLFESQNGLLTASIDGKLLHSKYDPLMAAKRFITHNKADYLNEKNIVVYGLGFGYHISELINSVKDDVNIYVFDIDEEIVNIAMQHSLCDWVNENPRVRLYVGYDEVVANLPSKLELVSNIIIYKPSMSVLPNEFNDFNEALNSFIISRRSIERHGEMATENYATNISLNCRGLNEFYSNYRIFKKPVVIAAGGPSLECDLITLNKYRDKVTIVALGRTLDILMKHNIKPDMIVIIDPQDIVYSQMMGYENLQVPLCFLSTASKLAVEKYNGPKFIFFNDRHNNNVDDIVIYTGKTVAIAAIDIAIKGGAKEVLFSGLDLAYIDKKFHAGDKIQEGISEPSDFKNVIGVEGEILNTTSGLLEFKKNIERLINENSNIEFINCSRGAKISGTIEKYLYRALEEI